MVVNFLSILSKVSVLEKIDEKAALRVAHMPRVVIFPALTVSKATSMESLTYFGLFGTHRVLPLFAMIWRRILVAMLLRLFFRRVFYVVIWQTTRCFKRAVVLSFLY